MHIITVCTGNICRSPVAEQALRAALTDFAPAVEGQITFGSAGTMAQVGQSMPAEAAQISRDFGGDPDAHGATFLTEKVLKGATLVLAMAREHRSAVLKIAPAMMKRTFTLREFARLADAVSDEQLTAALTGPLVGKTPEARLKAALGALANARGIEPAPEQPEDDDVIDPYKRGEQTYRLSAEQMRAGLEAVQRVLTLPAVWQD